MKKQKKPRIGNFKTQSSSSLEQHHAREEQEKIVVCIRQAEEYAIPLIRKRKLSPAAALYMLAQYTHILMTGNAHISMVKAVTMSDKIRALWQRGFYIPGKAYPYTLKETLEDEKKMLNPQGDYAAFFRPFIPTKIDMPLGLGEVAMGIVQHPETHLWQIWTILNGPCFFLAAFRELEIAQHRLEEIIDTTRKGGTSKDAERFYKRIAFREGGTSKQLPPDMMNYLIHHLHLYTIKL